MHSITRKIIVPASILALALPVFTRAQKHTTTPIKHVVVIFQENISFDHYFGTYPNATPNKDGSVYFGLGTADFTNAYLLKDGKSKYDLKGERGTVLEVSPDWKTRRVFATGIRFPVGQRTVAQPQDHRCLGRPFLFPKQRIVRHHQVDPRHLNVTQRAHRVLQLAFQRSLIIHLLVEFLSRGHRPLIEHLPKVDAAVDRFRYEDNRFIFHCPARRQK